MLHRKRRCIVIGMATLKRVRDHCRRRHVQDQLSHGLRKRGQIVPGLLIRQSESSNFPASNFRERAGKLALPRVPVLRSRAESRSLSVRRIDGRPIGRMGNHAIRPVRHLSATCQRFIVWMRHQNQDAATSPHRYTSNGRIDPAEQ